MTLKPLLLLFSLSLILITGCKNVDESHPREPASPAVAKEENPPEITNLSTANEISSAFSNSADSSSIGGLKLYYFPKVLDFYRQRDFKPVWNEPAIRQELLSEIGNIEEEGLFPSDYHYEFLQESSSPQNLEAESQTQLEIVLTDAFFRLLNHLNSGKLDPEELYEIWGTKKNKIEPSDFLQNPLKKGDVIAALDSARPKNNIYYGLKKSLQEYRELIKQEQAITQIEKGELIRPGENDGRIPSVAKRLREMGYQIDTDSLTSEYTEKIEKAVKQFQKDYGLQTDGIIGNSTLNNLNKTKSDRYRQLLANLERWRWYPHELGEHYIIINIANFELSVIKDGDTIEQHKTIVGTPGMKTPVFSDEIEYVVYNPVWTIPESIEAREIIPSASRDSNYLRNKGINIYRNGEKLDPAQWNSAEARAYTYRQRAGSANPLGRVKIIYPNKYMIYLHDTPAKFIFDRSTRADSHGCVRVENAVDLSKYLLSNREEYTSSKIDSIIAGGKTTQIEVTQPVQVHHFYWTAWRADGQTKFTSDIYNLDPEIYKLLKPDIN